MIPAESGLWPETAGFVLAGGRSSRMGTDKALTTLGGRPLIERALGILREAGLEPAIAGARSPLESLAPVIEDPEPDRGPLSGICAALNATSARWAVFLPVDLPFVPASLIRYLVQDAHITGATATMVSVNGFTETFPAVIERSALRFLQQELRAGRSGCIAAFRVAAAVLGEPVRVLPVEVLVETGHAAHPQFLPAMRWFLNLNAPADLQRAETQAAHLIG